MESTLKFDTLYNTCINNFETGIIVSDVQEKNTMNELYNLIEKMENPNDVYDRLGQLLDLNENNIEIMFAIVFKLLKKFEKNAVFQIQGVAILRYIITCEQFDVHVTNEYIDIIRESLDIVDTNKNKNIGIDDDQIVEFIENCIIILYKMNVNGNELKILEKMYNNYSNNLTHVHMFYTDVI